MGEKSGTDRSARAHFHTNWDGSVTVVRALEYVPEGFRSSGEMTPCALWGVLGHPHDDTHIRAVVKHNYNYATGRVSRLDADRELLRDLMLDGETPFRAIVQYAAVRLFGWPRYRKAKEPKTKNGM